MAKALPPSPFPSPKMGIGHISGRGWIYHGDFPSLFSRSMTIVGLEASLDGRILLGTLMRSVQLGGEG